MSYKVLVVGTTKESGGGITSVIRLIKKMPVWSNYQCYWLGTQVQAGLWIKVKTLLKSYFIAAICLWRYDIIHFHTVPGSGIRLQLPIFLLAKVLGKKIILHLHIGNQLERESELNDKVFRWSLKKANMIILLSKRFKEMLLSNYPEVRCPVRVLYNACEDVVALPYAEHNHTLLFAGAFTYNKAGDMLIKAFAQLQSKYPDWRLQMLGSGPWEDIYKSTARDMQVEENVDFLGYLTGEQKAMVFRKAGLYVMCSYLEGFPMVVLEAWAYGVPVITTPVGGMPDVIEEDRNACRFDFGDLDGLTRKLDHLMGNEQLREEMSTYCQNYVKEHFSLNRINNQLEEYYSELCQN